MVLNSRIGLNGRQKTSQQHRIDAPADASDRHSVTTDPTHAPLHAQVHGAAVAAAETGHLVLTSLHTASAPEAFDRILYFFPPNEENSVRQNLSSTLIAIMSQMLVPCVPKFAESAGTKRVPATEVLLNTPVVREYVRDKDKEQDLADLLTGELGGDLSGMHDFNHSLKELADGEMVARQSALEASLRPESLRMQFKGLKV